MHPSAHVDTFVLDNLPAAELLPDIINLDALGYPEQLNATTELVDAHLANGKGDRIALQAPGVRWSYNDLAAMINKIANVLTDKLGMKTGNRVMIRSGNNPTKIALYMAIIKAGGVVVATMPLLRAPRSWSRSSIGPKSALPFAITH